MKKDTVRHNLFCTVLFFVLLPNLCLGSLVVIFYPESFTELPDINFIFSVGIYGWLLYWNVKFLRGGLVICELTHDGFRFPYLDSKLQRLHQFVPWAQVVSVEKIKGVSYPSFVEVKIEGDYHLPKPLHGWSSDSAGVSKLTFMAPITFSTAFSWVELFDRYRGVEENA